MKKLITLMSIVAMVFCMMTNGSIVQAAEQDETICVDGSYLTHDTESNTEVYPRTKGVYLMKGTAILTNPAIGKISAGGTTVAKSTVNQIGVTVRVDRYINGSWVTYTTWNYNLYNNYYAGTSKILTVPRGYYYRVRTTHWAATDSAVGWTNGIWIA